MANEEKKSGSPVTTSGTRKDGFRNTQDGEHVGPDFALQRDAVAFGRKLAIESYSEHIIQDTKGRIRTKNSYGRDPKEIKG